MPVTSRDEAVEALLRLCSNGDRASLARLGSISSHSYSEGSETRSDSEELEGVDVIDSVFRQIQRDGRHPSLSMPHTPPPFTVTARELWMASIATCEQNGRHFVCGVRNTPMRPSPDDHTSEEDVPRRIATALEQRLNDALETYVSSYHFDRRAGTAFVRRVTDTPLVLEVLMFIVAEHAHAPPAMDAAHTSLFDADVFPEWDSPRVSGGAGNPPLVWEARRWVAGHAFEVRLDAAKALLQWRHQRAHLVCHVSRTEGNVRSDQMRLFPTRLGRMESVALRGGMGAEALNCVDAIAELLCARVEEVDNALVRDGVAPLVRVTLPRTAPSANRQWDNARRRSAHFAAAAKAAAARAKK